MSVDLWEEEILHVRGIEEEQPSMTPYLVQSNRPTGAVIICPGGGYARRANHEGEPVAKKMNEMGFSAFVLHYRVHPYKHPVPLTDLQRAIRIIRYYKEKWNIHSSKIGVLGFSAGGHLASTAGTQFDMGKPNDHDPIEHETCRPDFMILCYPVITFGTHSHQGSIHHLLGDNPTKEQKDALSNEKNVTPHTPPTFLWHTSDDPSVSVENSLLFASALKRNQVPMELHCYESGRHGLGLADDHHQAYTWLQLCELWLNKQMEKS